MKKILMIGTGGTIASRQTASGLSPSISPQDVLSYIPEVERICAVDTLQVCNLDSTSMQPQHWLLMARTIESNMTHTTALSSVMAQIRWLILLRRFHI